MRVRRSILNFATTALLMAVTMAVAFPAAPLLVGWLGDSVLGGVRVVNAAFVLLSLLELGLGGALAPLLAGAVGRNDERGLRDTVAAGSRAYLALAAGTVLVGLALTPVVPRFANGLSPPEMRDLRAAWVLQLVGVLPLVLAPLRTVVEARQMGYVVNLLLLAQSLLVTGLSLVLARARWGITGQVAAQVIGVWAFSLVLAVVTFRAHPGLFRAVLTTPTRPETRRSLRRLSVSSLVLNVSGRVGLLSDNLIVGGLLDTARVTSLGYTQKLATTGQSVLLAFGNSGWAALAELHVQGRHETFNRRLVEMTRLVAVLAAVGLVPVVAYNETFFRIWLGRKVVYGGDLVSVLAALNAVLVAEHSLWGWCFSATGKLRALVPVAAAQAVVNVLLSVAMTRWVGLPGPLIGSAVGLLFGLVTVPWLLRRSFGTPVGPLLRAFAVPTAAGAAAAWALHGLTRFHEPKGWGSLAAEMAAAALVMLAVGVFLLLTPEDRALWRQRLAALRPGRPVAPGL